MYGAHLHHSFPGTLGEIYIKDFFEHTKVGLIFINSSLVQ